MKAKNLMVAVLTALTITLFNACSPKETIIKAAVAGTNAMCPLEVRDGVSITKAEYTDGYVVYSAYCDADKYDVSGSFFTDENKDAYLELLREKLAGNDNVKFLDALKSSDVGITIRYYNETGSTDLTLAPEDLQRLLE